jgi:DNA-binding HxlR family transcriptional regulator
MTAASGAPGGPRRPATEQAHLAAASGAPGGPRRPATEQAHLAAAAGAEIERLAPLSDALAAVGDRWSLMLVASLLDGPRRFGELQDRLSGIAPNVLSQRLRQLENQRLVLATPYSDRPRRFLYELAQAGHELAGALRLLTDWGTRHAGGAAPAHRHEACGTPLEARWYCPTCQEPVDAPQDGDGGLYYA